MYFVVQKGKITEKDCVSANGKARAAALTNSQYPENENKVIYEKHCISLENSNGGTVPFRRCSNRRTTLYLFVLHFFPAMIAMIIPQAPATIRAGHKKMFPASPVCGGKEASVPVVPSVWKEAECS